jgi:excinuclease ABC subunit C
MPPVIIVNQDVSAALRNLLEEQSERRVHLVSNPISERRVWLEMAEKNAMLAIQQRLSSKATQQHRVAQLNEALGWKA